MLYNIYYRTLLLYFIQATEVLLSDYRQVSIMAVYWEKMIEDEVFHENSEHKTVMEDAENKLYQILCTQYTGLKQSVGQFVEPSVMPDKYRYFTSNRGKTNRFMRDYVIARDTMQILKSMESRYVHLRSSMNT